VTSAGALRRPEIAGAGAGAMQRMLVEIGASVGASVVMLAATVVGGHLIAGTAPPVGVERPAYVGCDERPLSPVNGTTLRAVARLCLFPHGAEPTVELEGMPSGALYSAWVAYVERPTVVEAGRCASPALAAREEIGAPGRVASGIADRAGQVVLSSALPGFQAQANSLVEILIVDHGMPSADPAPARPRELLAWDRAWSAPPVPPDQPSSALLGCTAFWVRGGAEQTEH
jgi:hypothetical protein